MTDEPGWITKADAATLLGVDERTIERRARAGKLNAKARPGFPTLYWAADVEKLAQTSPQEVRTGILAAVPPGPSNGKGHIESTPDLHGIQLRPGDDPIRQLAAAFRAFLLAPTGPTGPTGGATGPTDGPTVTPTGPTAAYVDKTTALAIAGVSYGALRAAVKAGEVKQRGRGYRRKDLEVL